MRNHHSGKRFQMLRPSSALVLKVLAAGIVLGWGWCGSFGSVLPRADRQWQDRLQQVQQRLAEGRLAEAIPLLDQMLRQGPDTYILWDVQNNLYMPVWRAARLIVESLPPEGQQQFEAFSASAAQRALHQAACEGDREQFRRIFVQYPVSRFGAEAALVLAANAWDRADWTQLAVWSQRVLTNPRSTSRQRAQALLWLVWAHAYRGQMDQARQAAEKLLSLPEAQQLVVGGRSLKGIGSWDQLADRLGLPPKAFCWQQAKEPAGATQSSPSPGAWTMWRGEPGRNGSMAWSGTFGQRQWHLPILEVQKWFGPPLPYPLEIPCRLPVWQPIFWKNLVLIRFPMRLIAVDLNTGRRLWQYPPEGDPVLQQIGQQFHMKISLEGPPLDAPPSPLLALIRQRLYDDQLYGRMSVHDFRLFLLEDLHLPEPTVYSVPDPQAGRPTSYQYRPPESNRLVALDLRREGKLLWSIGGPLGEQEPALEGVFFLDVPLVVEDTLYVLAERRQEILLVALSPQTGQLLWSLPIAMIDEGQAVFRDVRRRLSGASIAYHDGVLVCPTGASSIVAVDLCSRSILWAHQYTPAISQLALTWLAMGGPGGIIAPFNPMIHPTLNISLDFSLEFCPMVADSRLVMAPSDSEELFCLELATGRVFWRQKIAKLRYLGGIAEQVILAVHNQAVSAWDLASGKPVWDEPMRRFPEGYLLAGRGFRHGRRYYLPVARGPRAALLALDIPTGRWEATMPLPPKTRSGTMAAWNDLLLCYSEAGLEAFGPPSQKP
ncbi:MAG: PQQ-binding-like beta-propeller repeat protein [Thermoguttaceae bacterium]|nr:PQQ-binding-like beta-propeller repeat protein [Thermoguttaceae bacterium]MDW8037894.1 PQQ-binding-like beta-propeller repeat protein [Thermoguttaceae bacterium]